MYNLSSDEKRKLGENGFKVSENGNVILVEKAKLMIQVINCDTGTMIIGEERSVLCKEIICMNPKKDEIEISVKIDEKDKMLKFK